jgi:hypothetical protein
MMWVILAVTVTNAVFLAFDKNYTGMTGWICSVFLSIVIILKEAA